ncbi:carboxy terminal-processing peptidase [Flavisolibacter ginsenosidimutans]|uniref:Tail-specific protease n=2 Tax=Flavisolibacter ginsenosidimutans TaxID=661481 RepID=A0A5B8UD81_9BACT|nr:tail-specific protease [Flavisolibacter ginsenosidimutans]
MKRLPIVLALVLAGVFFAFRSQGKTNTLPPGKYEKILQIVGAILTQGHYEPKTFDDDFSRKIFNKYFEDLDPEKNIFLQADVKSLDKYSTTIDEEVKGAAPVTFFKEAGKIFDVRIKEAEAYYKEILAKPFDFTKDETYNADADKKPFPATEAARKEEWRKYLKYLTLQRYADLLDSRESSKGKEGAINKTDAELEKEARDKVSAAMARTFDRYHNKFTEEDKFDVFVNTITEMEDPHTEFMPPLDKRYFDETMSGKFYGIGAQLQYDEGNIKIASILPGGPAQKSGQVEAGDIIVRVAQGKEAPVELSGFTVQDAVKLIRGKKDTEVKLTLRKKDGTLKTIDLVRDEIVQDEAYVRSVVINEGSQKTGYIYLPEFYADFNEMNGVRSGMDVAKEVNKLKAEGVDGIVIDLRNNGGGALYDVIQIAGLFIDQGPVVQVRDRQGKPQVMKDRDEGVVYDGPLVVMVNEMSASASEILAAAIQDYGRGVIIGSTSTYGKGTVQRTIGLDPESNFSNQNSELGSLKLTLQKFYRISGGSTQQRGVQPDIVVPDYLERLKIRERDNPYSLPYDEISKATYNKWKAGYNLDVVKQAASTRIAADTTFKRIQDASVYVGKQNDKAYSLQLDKYRQDQKQIRDAIKRIDNLTKLQKPLATSFLKVDESKYVSADKDKNERYKQWLSGVSKDVYVDQAVKVIKDIVSQQNLAKSSEKKEPVKAF